jgi:hypothetical protein
MPDGVSVADAVSKFQSLMGCAVSKFNVQQFKVQGFNG